MSNQWGRESGGFSGGRTSRAPLILSVLIALGLGIAGGYGAARMFGPDSTAAVAAAEQKAAGLQAETERLAGKLSAAKGELEAARAAAEAGLDADTKALRDTIARQASELDAMTGQLAAASAEKQAALAEAETQAAAANALTKERDALKESAAAGADLAHWRDEVAPGLEAERKKLAAEVDRLTDEAKSLQGQASILASAKAEGDSRIAELEGQLADIQAKLAETEQALAAATAQADAKPDDKAAGPADTTTTKPPQGGIAADGTLQGVTLTPRDADAVEAALRAAPGLDTLSAADRARLKEMLVAGECVTTALRDVFQHVPILALRSLILGLHSGC